jgi:hypothetical protein
MCLFYVKYSLSYTKQKISFINRKKNRGKVIGGERTKEKKETEKECLNTLQNLRKKF